jgi:hypothetical protein
MRLASAESWPGIFVEVKSPWLEIIDDLPQYDLPGFIGLRAKTKLPE